MSIKINNKMLSIPPHLSTTWHQVASIHKQEENLVITLYDGNSLEIPNLTLEETALIFSYHAQYLDSQAESEMDNQETALCDLKELLKEGNHSSLRFGFSTSIDGANGLLSEHNPAFQDAPEIPSEILEKIVTITTILSPFAEGLFPKDEEGCNCFHCQISRALVHSKHEKLVEPESVVSDQELQFEQWMIEETEPNLFKVVNKLDQEEKYRVCLGARVGCTCGKEGCEHLLAVLKS